MASAFCRSFASKTSEFASPVETLGELMALIENADDIPANKKRYVLSALRRTRALLGNGAADIKADPKMVLQRLAQLAPAMAGMGHQSFANLKSRVRSAFRYASPRIKPARSWRRLKGVWAQIDQALEVGRSRELSRFLRFADGNGWLPEEIGSGHLERFTHYLAEEALIEDFTRIVRATARAWNSVAQSRPDLQLKQLPVLPLKRERYWVEWESLPSALRQEIEDYLARRINPDPFLAGPSKALSPYTVQQYRYFFIQLASALVALGTPCEQLGSITHLLLPCNVEAALRFFYARGGDRVTEQVLIMAARAYKVAKHHKSMLAQDVEELAAIWKKVREAAPVQRGLTAKNRKLLERLEDQAFADRLLMLPKRLMETAVGTKNPGIAAGLARDAVAIELLLLCGMRVGNLVDLRIGETIRRYGEGRHARWVIEIPPEKVKNNQPLRFVLPEESAWLLELYLEKWHLSWCGPSEWLFPNSTQGHIDTKVLSTIIAKRTQRLLGVPITCHQFRHLAAEIYLRDDPNGIGVISQHLGHRDLNTTRRFYAREQTRVATKRYQEVLARNRAAAGARKRKSKPRRSRDHDPASSVPETP
jgi:integrase